MKYIKVAVKNKAPSRSIVARCANCQTSGTLNLVGDDFELDANNRAGMRSCPNPSCKALIFVTYGTSSLSETYPRPLIAFDPSNIPEAIRKVFIEAIHCHAIECYTASAIMIRRTLEEICSNQRATGENLFKRIEDLSSKIVIPSELKEALHELRLLGNDAAHIDAATFKKIDEEEIEVAIEFTKEILKATYQYSTLLARLRSLKKPQQ